MRSNKRIKIKNPFRFLTFLLVSLVATSTLVTQAVKLFATGEIKATLTKEELKEDKETSKNYPIEDIIVEVGADAEANDVLYQTTAKSEGIINAQEVNLKEAGVVVQDSLKIKVNDVKWFKDEEYSSKQGIAILLNLENLTEGELVVGRYVNDMLSPSLSYEDTILKAYSQGVDDISGSVYGFTTLISNFKNYKYIKNTVFASEKTCDASITLNPRETSSCYLTYDYAGEGDYRLSFQTDDSSESFGNLKLTTATIEEK